MANTREGKRTRRSDIGGVLGSLVVSSDGLVDSRLSTNSIRMVSSWKALNT